MASSIHYFSGRCFWARLQEHNLDVYNDVKSAQIEIELDPEQRKALKNSGSKVTPKLQDDGTVRVKFKRRFENPIDEFGGLPTVINAEGAPINDLIGNGSKVTVKVVVYDTKLGKGTRLETVRVDELIPYVKEENEENTVSTTFLVGIPF